MTDKKQRIPRKGRKHRSISALCIDAIRYINEPNFMVRAIRTYFSASAAVLWLRDTHTVDEFTAYAADNRPDLDLDGDVHFFLDDNSIVSSEAFENNKSVTGVIGKFPFSGEWLSKEYTRALPDLGLIGITIIPINDRHRHPFAALSLYFKTDPTKKPLRATEVETIQRLILNIFNEVISERDMISGEHRKMGHEIVASVNSLRSSISNLKKHAQREYPDDLRLEDYLDEIITTSDIIENAAVQQKFSSLVRDERKKATLLSFRSAFNAAAQPLIRQRSSRRASLAPIRIIGGNDCYVLMAQQHLQQIINNLVSNAIKYSAVGGTIVSELRLPTAKEDSAEFQISNLSEPIPADVGHRIWNYNYRSDRAEKSDEPGEGIGLAIVKEICEVYGLRADYKQDAHEGKDLTWIRFSIFFPPEVLGD